MVVADALTGASFGPGLDCVVEGGIAVLTMNNPPVNAVTVALAQAIGTAAERLGARADIRAVILTAAGGRIFSAGSDIREFSTLLGPGEAVQHKLRPQLDAFAALEAMPQPTIAMVNGICLGAGLEIAICCDLLVAEDHAVLGSPEIQLGLFPSSGGTFRAARRIGTGRAKEMQFLGEPVSANRALQWGLVNSVVPTGAGMATARGLAQRLANLSPIGLAGCKRVINAVHDLPESALRELSLDASDAAFTSRRCRAEVDRFLSRKPGR